MKPEPHVTSPVTANEMMKQRSRAWLPRSIVLAVMIHFAVLSLAPDMMVADMTSSREPPEMITFPSYEPPPPPEQIARPASPIIGDYSDIPPDLDAFRSNLDAWQPDVLAAPPAAKGAPREEFERFVPSMVAPSLMNAAQVERELVRNYPQMLRDAGIGGQVDVNLWLDENGAIVRSEVARSSGYDALDAAALRVVSVMKLSPARNRDRAVRVIVTLPVRFTTR